MDYYVDSINGNDANAGDSPALAFKSIQKANSILLKPGDSLKLKCGSVFNEVLKPQGSGNLNNRITIESYDTGNMPKIVMNSNNSWNGGLASNEHHLLPYVHHGDIYNNYKINACIVLKNQEYITVKDIELEGTNTATNNEFCNGLLCIAEEYGKEINGVIIENLYVHDIQNKLSNIYKYGAGIHFITQYDYNTPKANRKKSWFDGAIVRNNRVENVGREGIRFVVNGWVEIPTSTGFDFSNNSYYRNASCGEWVPHKNILIENNTLDKIAGDGIVLESCSKSIIQNNKVFAANCKNTFAVGIFPWNSIDILIQNNMVIDTKGGGDSQGIEIDALCARVFVQYNFIRNSAGGLFMFCGTGDLPIYDSHFRFNIYESNRTTHGMFDVRHNIKNCSIHNNTIYFSKETSKDANLLAGTHFYSGENTDNPNDLNQDFWYGHKCPLTWINDSRNTVSDSQVSSRINKIGPGKIKYYNNVIFTEKGSLWGSMYHSYSMSFSIIDPVNIDFCKSVMDYKSNMYVNMGNLSVSNTQELRTSDQVFNFHQSSFMFQGGLNYNFGKELDRTKIASSYTLITPSYNGTEITNIPSSNGSFSYNGSKNFYGENITPNNYPIGAM